MDDVERDAMYLRFHEATAEVAAHLRHNSEVWFPELHERDHWQLVIAYALGLAGEAGETVDCIKKINRDGKTHDPKQKHLDNLELEAADLLVYLLLLADEMCLSLADALRKSEVKNIVKWGDPVELAAPPKSVVRTRCNHTRWNAHHVAPTGSGEIEFLWRSRTTEDANITSHRGEIRNGGVYSSGGGKLASIPFSDRVVAWRYLDEEDE